MTTPSMQPRTTSRRRLLAVAAATVPLAGCQGGDTTPAATEPGETSPDRSPAQPGSGDTSTVRPVESFDLTTVDLGDEGLSPGDSLDPYFDDFLESGIRIVIPEGEYTHSATRQVRRMHDVALVGDGPVVIDQGDGYENKWQHKNHSGLYEMRNITWRGKGASGDGVGQWGSFAASSDGRILIDNCAWPDGTHTRSDGHCIYVFPEHAGDMLVRNTHIEDFGDNGLYGSAPGRGQEGPVRVENCFFRNNNVANVRLGSTGSYVKDSVLIQTGRAPLTASGHRNANNVKHRQNSDIRVENCDLVHTGRRWTLTIHGDVEEGSVTMLDNRIRHTSSDDVCNNNPDVDVLGSGNQFTGEWDDTLPAGIFACINDDCREPSTDWQ